VKVLEVKDTVKALFLIDPSTNIAAPFAPARLFVNEVEDI
jgi:hypothetical protein